jgi:protein-S-isoprenylcysteine O-methyltransferase Ste14
MRSESLRRNLVLAYGILAYLAFLGVALYAIGFVGDLAVPRSLDSAPPAPPAEALLVNLGLLAVFAVQHTIMARPAFKRWWTRFVPPAAERATFVLAASASLALLFWQWRGLPATVWHVEAPAARALLQGAFWAGWAVFLVASFQIHHGDLFGLRQVWLRWKGLPYSPLPFRVRGLYRWMRHPIQVGFLMAFWATPHMTQSHLLFAAVTTVYILVAVKVLEERDLLATFGETYRRYMADVGGFLPRLAFMARYRSWSAPVRRPR